MTRARRDPLVCEHCGGINWRLARDLELTLAYVARRLSATSHEIATRFRISISNANNRLTRLAKLGVVHRAESQAVPGTGGREFVFRHGPRANVSTRRTPDDRR